jgi:hypothetical protein
MSCLFSLLIPPAYSLSPSPISSSIPGLFTDVEHFLKCGADKVLLKPLDIDAFSAAMTEMAATSQAQPNRNNQSLNLD